MEEEENLFLSLQCSLLYDLIPVNQPFTPNMQELDPAVDSWKDVSEFIPMQLLTKSSSRPLEHNAEKKR